MIEGEDLALPPEAAGAAKAYLRVERADEDDLIAGLVLAAAELCEAFIGRPLLERDFIETIPAGRAWRRLGFGPVRSITQVRAIAGDGAEQVLAAQDYGIDIDRRGDGWVRTTAPAGARRIRVEYRAGLAAGWAQVPAALRQGVLRLAAHFYTSRASEGPNSNAPPAAVTALWRPFRRLRLH